MSVTMTGKASIEHKELHMKFHGRIIDQLGSQTYQSPIASIAELIANAWDADAHNVDVRLPDSNSDDAVIVIEDDGYGLSFQECEDNYLNIGFCRRGGRAISKTEGGRPVLGRKGIGKFAGFGIARIISVDTVSKRTGEKTSFEMDIDKVTQDGYMEKGGLLNAKFLGPDEARKGDHGTKITLKNLITKKSISKSQFPTSISRRFLLNATADNFQIKVDGNPIPESADLNDIEFSFPKNYHDKEIPDGMRREGDMGVETLDNGKEVRWRVYFYRNTIREPELQGVAVFANHKLAQQPFFFKLSGGLGGQHGQSYMSGQVIAEYLDQMPIDPMSTERQRVNWDLEDTKVLLEWGQAKVKSLLVLWRNRRGARRERELEERVAAFSERLEKLHTSEAKIVKTVLKKLGEISSLSDDEYESVSKAILTAWEGGRLRNLMETMSNADILSSGGFLKMLVEAQVISALNVAEVIKTKNLAIERLDEMIRKKDLEDNVRNHLAENPWILSPRWDTFSPESGVNTIIKRAAEKVGLLDEKYRRRIDMALSSGNQLLIVEFMRPSQKLDWDHLSRLEQYVRKIRKGVESATQSRFQIVDGLIVADKIDRDLEMLDKIKDLDKNDNIRATDWDTLLDEARKEHNEYMKILVQRGDGDARLDKLLE